MVSGITDRGRMSIIAEEGETVAPVDTSRPWGERLRRLGPALIAGGFAIIPWLFVLAFRLPASTQAAHWSTAWVGLDTFEAIGLVTTGVLVRLGDERRCLAAVASATLLLADAWFDVTTAAPGPDHATAVLMAVFLELPIAALCAVLAIRTFPGR
jgi:hypothetical protein